jgi:hypothetical protein
VRVAAIDSDVVSIEQFCEFPDRPTRGIARGSIIQTTRGGSNLRTSSGTGALRSLANHLGDLGALAVVSDTQVPAAHKPARHMGARPSEPEHSKPYSRYPP